MKNRESHRRTVNPKISTPRHIIIKVVKVKDIRRILKAAKEKQLITHKRNPIRVSANFPAETLQARREWQDIFKVLKVKKKLQHRILYAAKLLDNIKRHIKSFPAEQKTKEFITIKPALQEILKSLL